MASAAPPADHPRVPHPSLGRLLIALVPAVILVPVASDMVSLILPDLAQEFSASTAESAWVVTGFLLACAIGIPIFGRLTDRIGLRRLFVAALAAYAVGSLVCAIAPTLPALVLGRIVAGAGGAAIPVLSIVAATRLLPRTRVAIAVGCIAAAGGAGAALGPAIGGGLGQWLGWRSLFWLVAVAALLILPVVATVLPAAQPHTPGHLDLLGGMLLGAGVGLLLFGITRAEGAHGFAAATSWAPILVSVLAFLGVFARSRHAPDPFVPPALFGHRGYPAAVGVIFLAMLVNLSALVLVSIMVIEVDGLTPGEGSLVMIPGGLALALSSAAVGRLRLDHARDGTMTLIGLGAIAGAMLLVSAAAGRGPALAAVAITLLGAGFGVVVTLTTNAVSQLLLPQLIGSGVGIFQSAQFIGAGAGPALFGALLTWIHARGAPGVNPLGTHAAAGYSDVFLVLAIVAALAALPAVRLRAARMGHAESDTGQTGAA